MQKKWLSLKEIPQDNASIVRSHPITGEKSIYVNRLFTVGIEGMADAEAQPLLDKLFASASQPSTSAAFVGASTQ